MKGGNRVDATTKRAVFETLTSLGGIYIKFLQVLATGAQFMRGWSGPAEMRVFEGVPFESIDIIPLLQKELGPDRMRQFSYIETQPFSAGSFAQVYKATLQDGGLVAIKVLRPSLVRTIRNDLRLIRLVGRMIQFMKPSALLDVRSVVQEFVETALKETDYAQEAVSMKWFASNFSKDPNIVVPNVYEHLSTRHILTQEFIGGISVAELLNRMQQGENAEQVIRNEIGSDLWLQLDYAARSVVRATLWSDFVFGDPHPGNMKLLPGNKVAFIDYGIVVEAPANRRAWLAILAEYKDLFADNFDPGAFMLSAIQFFDEELASSLYTLEEIMSDNVQVTDMIGGSAKQNFARTVRSSPYANSFQKKHIIRIFTSLINNDNRYGIKINTQGLTAIKAGRACLEIIRQLATNREDEKLMLKVLSEEVSYAEKNADLLPVGLPEKQIGLDRAAEILISWMSHVADNDPLLYSQIASMQSGELKHA